MKKMMICPGDLSLKTVFRVVAYEKHINKTCLGKTNT